MNGEGRGERGGWSLVAMKDKKQEREGERFEE